MGHDLFQGGMAFVGETPWHRLGTAVESHITAEQMMCAANLDWRVRKQPAPGARLLDAGRKVYDRYIVLRDPVGDETEAVALAIVGKDYESLQNVDAFTFFEPFIDNGWAEFHTAGALGNGERVWALARLSEQMVIHGDDPVDRFLLLSNSHDGSSAVTVRFTPVRVVCQNTLSLAQAGGTGVVSVRHTRKIRHNLKKTQAQALKRLSDAVFAEAGSLFACMAECSVAPAAVDGYLETLFPRTRRQKTQGLEPERWARVKQILGDEAVTPSATRETLWALYNAVVRDEDYRRTREVTADARLERVWFGRGYGLKRKALETARVQLDSAA